MTPIERAVTAFTNVDDHRMYVSDTEMVRIVFDSIDPDELARAIGAVSWHPSAAETRPDVAHAIATAVKAWLEGGGV